VATALNAPSDVGPPPLTINQMTDNANYGKCRLFWRVNHFMVSRECNQRSVNCPGTRKNLIHHVLK